VLKFVISDNGIGIDPEFLPHIYDPFAREDDSATDRYGGSGLSLAVSKNMVERMGGTIEVSSRKNEGTEFAVTVPVKRIKIERIPEPVMEVSLAGRRILIAEDVKENAEIVADLLELEDAESEHAENGQIAVEMFRNSSVGYYDVILMDLRMPVMDGLEATRRIRALDRPDAKTVPIIALTANSFESDKKQTKEAGMNEHLGKPADAELLYATIRKWLQPS
jgi:CheY-like chemotaxis protein